MNPEAAGALVGHYDGITYIDSRGDGRYIISNSKDQSIKLWDLRVFSPADAVAKSKNHLCYGNWDYRWDEVPKRCKLIIINDFLYRTHCFRLLYSSL